MSYVFICCVYGTSTFELNEANCWRAAVVVGRVRDRRIWWKAYAFKCYVSNLFTSKQLTQCVYYLFLHGSPTAPPPLVRFLFTYFCRRTNAPFRIQCRFCWQLFKAWNYTKPLCSRQKPGIQAFAAFNIACMYKEIRKNGVYSFRSPNVRLCSVFVAEGWHHSNNFSANTERLERLRKCERESET